MDELRYRDEWDDGEPAGILPFVAILGGSVVVSLLLLAYLLWEIL